MIMSDHSDPPMHIITLREESICPHCGQLVHHGLPLRRFYAAHLVRDGVTSIVGRGTLRLQASKSAMLPAGWENHISFEIDPDYRGRGLGHALLAALLREAWSAGLREVRLSCAAGNMPAIRVIARAGGELIDRAPVTAGRGAVNLYRVERPNT